ncbi:MAG: hypothetical protein GXP34_00790 [Actinobacteria bacterium]|nr:hypothetical protein [Actinomycetota bacterium]
MAQINDALLDWPDTLVEYPEPAWRVRRALETLGPSVTGRDMDGTIDRFQWAERHPQL